MADPNSLLDMMSDQPPADNPAVLAAIDRQRQQWQQNVNSYDAQGGNGLLQYGAFSPAGQYTGAAMQPGMSGYFDVDPVGNINPKIFDPRQVAQQSGETLGQLAGSLLPGGDRGRVGYDLPNTDRSHGYNLPNEDPNLTDNGGFFRLQDVWPLRQANTGGAPIAGAVQIGENLPSTNNWRLLGRGPGWIMRNGQMINTRAPGTRMGMLGGASLGAAGPAENGAMGYIPFVAPGNALMGGNVADAMYWPGADQFTGYTRWPFGTDV